MTRGTFFEHAHWLDPSTDKPLVCKVTRVAMGSIYYRPFYGLHMDGTEWLGAPAYFPIEQWTKYASGTLTANDARGAK